jgi:hypothetical protein
VWVVLQDRGITLEGETTGEKKALLVNSALEWAAIRKDEVHPTELTNKASA